MTYKINQFVKKISSPILVRFDDKEMKFDNGVELADFEFKHNIIITEMKSVDSIIVITLSKNIRINDTNIVGEEQAHFF